MGESQSGAVVETITGTSRDGYDTAVMVAAIGFLLKRLLLYFGISLLDGHVLIIVSFLLYHKKNF